MNGTLLLFLEKKKKGGGYHDDSRNYWPKVKACLLPPCHWRRCNFFFSFILSFIAKKMFWPFLFAQPPPPPPRVGRWRTLMTPLDGINDLS